MLQLTEELSPYVAGWDLTERQVNVRQCSDLIREIMGQLIGSDLSAPTLAELQEILASARDVARAHSSSDAAPYFVPGSEIHPWVGPSNAIAPPMHFHLEGEVLVGLVRCSQLYGGGAGRVHGGVISGLFDAVIATRSAMSGASMTAKLVVNYRRPVPLNVDLRVEAMVDRIEGRKCFVIARLHHGATLCAEAEALMITARPE